MKGYIDYLISRYIEYRKVDATYARTVRFTPAVLHKNIERSFGAKTFFLPETKFSDLVAHLTAKIDNTIQGRRNGANGTYNYHSFGEHRRRHGL